MYGNFLPKQRAGRPFVRDALDSFFSGESLPFLFHYTQAQQGGHAFCTGPLWTMHLPAWSAASGRLQTPLRPVAGRGIPFIV